MIYSLAFEAAHGACKKTPCRGPRPGNALIMELRLRGKLTLSAWARIIGRMAISREGDRDQVQTQVIVLGLVLGTHQTGGARYQDIGNLGGLMF